MKKGDRKEKKVFRLTAAAQNGISIFRNSQL